MTYIQWSSRFELGVPFIDEDHKTLVSLLNRMSDASRSDGDLANVGSILSALVDYTRYHFEREERAQAIAKYPDIEPHCVLHEELAGQAVELLNNFRNDPASIDMGDVLDFLRDWLLDHILLHDMAIRPYVKASAEAVSDAAGSVNYAGWLSDDVKAENMDWAKVSILVLEDSKAFSSVLQSIMKSIGVGKVVALETTAEGLDVAKSQKFDVIFSDWRLAEGDGLEFIRSLRSAGNLTPVVMLTGYVDESIEATREGFEASEWLQKPVTSAELTSCLLRHLS